MFYQKQACQKKPLQSKDLNIHYQVKQTAVAKNQYQKLDKVHEFDEKEKDKTINKEKNDEINKKLTLKKYNKSDLIYNSNHGLYHDINKFNDHQFESKYKDLISFCQELNEFRLVE